MMESLEIESPSGSKSFSTSVVMLYGRLATTLIFALVSGALQEVAFISPVGGGSYSPESKISLPVLQAFHKTKRICF